MKKNIFWIGVGVVILGAGIFWAATVLAKQETMKQMKGESDARLEALEDYAKRPRDLRNEQDTAKVVIHKKALEKVEEKIRTDLEGEKDEAGRILRRSVNLNIDPTSFIPPPLVDDVARFRQWIDLKYDTVCAEARQNGMICRVEDLKAHGRTPLDEMNLENIPTVLKQFVISREIHRILSTTKVKIPSIEIDTDTREEKVIMDTRGVQFLNRIEFLTALEMASKRTKTSGQPMGMMEPEPPMAEPFQRHLFELEFAVHYSVVPEILRKLIASSEFFLVITRMDIRRQPQVFGRKTRRGTFMPGRRTTAVTGEERMLLNSRDNEAPVVVVLECQVLEFNFEAVTAPNKGAR